MELTIPPAKTYGFNVVASIIDRLAMNELGDTDRQQLQDALDDQLIQIDSPDIPDMPVWESEVISLAKQFDIKLLNYIFTNPRPNIPPSLADKAAGIVIAHIERLEEAEGRGRLQRSDMISTSDIASAFGMSNLFDNAEETLSVELDEWSSQTDHPNIPPELQKPASRDVTVFLLKAAWKELFGYTEDIEANVYVTDSDRRHLYWVATDGVLDYATPDQYSLDVQLSFDIPHNATHLLHLHSMNAGVLGYLDRMPERAYFESVALLSEYMVTQLAVDSSYFMKLSEVFGMSSLDTARWIQDDRRYEFKLRTARYLGDVLISQGSSYDDTTNEVSSILNIPLNHARAEVSKYLPWLGLNAVYIKGFRNLISMGIHSVQDAIEPNPGTVVKSWKELHKIVDLREE